MVVGGLEETAVYTVREDQYVEMSVYLAALSRCRYVTDIPPPGSTMMHVDVISATSKATKIFLS